MAEPEILFEVNASQILAKLHLAGLLPCSYDKNRQFIINTGIKDDNPNAKPDNPGKVEFDLGNSLGEYEIGFVTELGPFPFVTGFTSIIEQIQKIIALLKTQIGDKDGVEDTEGKPFLSKDELKKGKTDLFLGDIKEALDAINDILLQNEEKIKKSIGDLKHITDDFFNTKLKSASEEEKEILKLKKSELLPLNLFYEYIDSLIKNLQEANKSDDNNTEIEKKREEARKEAIEQLTKYLLVFIGPDNMNSFKADDIVMINISDLIKNSNDSKLVKMYEIIPISDLERETLLKKFETHPDKCIEKVCFKIGYTILIEK